VAEFRKVLLVFIIAVLPLAMVAVFEVAKGWLLYTVITNTWSDYGTTAYLRRGGIVRAIASASNPIILGFVVMVSIGSVMALWRTFNRVGAIALSILGAALIATVSRGPWIGAVILVLINLATTLNVIANVARLALLGAILLLPLMLTPIGGWLFDLLPFVGSVDSSTYRQHLFENAILVIERNPWFGSSDYLSTPEMKEMIQGEQIIDIVNSYLRIALDTGLVGLGLFVSFFAMVLVGLWRIRKLRELANMSMDKYASASIATLIAMLVTIGTVSSIDFIPYVYWSFAGLCVALIRIAYREQARLRIARRAAVQV
jgi:O-antigen ligase